MCLFVWQKASTTQELLKSVQEELCELKQINSDLEKLRQEKECSLDQQVSVYIIIIKHFFVAG